MHIESRKKTSLIMCCLWILVPVTTVVANLSGYVANEFYMVMAISGIANLFGVAYILGHYNIMSGFSTMTSDEIKKYNMDAISRFSGTYYFSVSYALFLSALYIAIIFGTVESVIASAIIFVVLMIFWAIYIATSDKFINSK